MRYKYKNEKEEMVNTQSQVVVIREPREEGCQKDGMSANVDLESFCGPPANGLNDVGRQASFSTSCHPASMHGVTTDIGGKVFVEST